MKRRLVCPILNRLPAACRPRGPVDDGGADKIQMGEIQCLVVFMPDETISRRRHARGALRFDGIC
jgi:hypothetical protein